MFVRGLLVLKLFIVCGILGYIGYAWIAMGIFLFVATPIYIHGRMIMERKMNAAIEAGDAVEYRL